MILALYYNELFSICKWIRIVHFEGFARLRLRTELTIKPRKPPATKVKLWVAIIMHLSLAIYLEKYYRSLLILSATCSLYLRKLSAKYSLSFLALSSIYYLSFLALSAICLSSSFIFSLICTAESGSIWSMCI